MRVCNVYSGIMLHARVTNSFRPPLLTPSRPPPEPLTQWDSPGGHRGCAQLCSRPGPGVGAVEGAHPRGSRAGERPGGAQAVASAAEHPGHRAVPAAVHAPGEAEKAADAGEGGAGRYHPGGGA
eukprot:1196145-Prorocentrum_minimum.AAC.2